MPIDTFVFKKGHIFAPIKQQKQTNIEQRIEHN